MGVKLGRFIGAHAGEGKPARPHAPIPAWFSALQPATAPSAVNRLLPVAQRGRIAIKSPSAADTQS